MDALIQGAITLGLSTCLTLYFVFQATQREALNSERYAKLEEYIRTDLEKLANKSEETITRNIVTTDRNTKVIEHNTQVIERLDKTLERYEARHAMRQV